MLSTDDEVGVERSCRLRVRPLAVELVEEAFDEVKRRVGLDRLVTVPEACERGQGHENETARACSTVGGNGSSVAPPHADTAVRIAFIGFVEAGMARRMSITEPGMGPVGRRCAGSQSPVQRRFATAGYEPCSTRSPIR